MNGTTTLTAPRLPYHLFAGVKVMQPPSPGDMKGLIKTFRALKRLQVTWVPIHNLDISINFRWDWAWIAADFMGISRSSSDFIAGKKVALARYPSIDRYWKTADGR